MLGRIAGDPRRTPREILRTGAATMSHRRGPRTTPSSLGRALLFALAALALGAGAAAAATPADTLIWDIAAGPQYVDPVMGTSAQANVMVIQNVYERLVWYDRASTQVIPWLATGWEVRDGGRRYIFKLRKG